jgi:hypothetical protein
MDQKCHLDVGPVAKHKVYNKGEGDGFPQIQAVVNLCESKFARGLSMHQKCFSYALTNLLFGLCMSV